MRRLPEAITAAMVARVRACEHRFHLDRTGDSGQRDADNPFDVVRRTRTLRLERDALDALAPKAVDLRGVPVEERASDTALAVSAFAPLIIGGRIEHADLVGTPAILMLDPHLGYLAGAVATGAGRGAARPDLAACGADAALRLAHDASILARLRWGPARAAAVQSAEGEASEVDLRKPCDETGEPPVTLHSRLLARARLVRNGAIATLPVPSSACASCPWRTICGGIQPGTAALPRGGAEPGRSPAHPQGGISAVSDARLRGLPGGAHRPRRHRAGPDGKGA